MLIHTTFGITFLSAEKFLKQRQNTTELYVKADNDKIYLHVTHQNHPSQYETTVFHRVYTRYEMSRGY